MDIGSPSAFFVLSRNFAFWWPYPTQPTKAPTQAKCHFISNLLILNLNNSDKASSFWWTGGKFKSLYTHDNSIKHQFPIQLQSLECSMGFICSSDNNIRLFRCIWLHFDSQLWNVQCTLFCNETLLELYLTHHTNLSCVGDIQLPYYFFT